MLKQINQAREEGYEDGEILNHLFNEYSGLKEPISRAVKEGFEDRDILDYIGQVYPNERIAKKKLKELDIQQAEEVQQARESQAEDRGFISSVQRGYGRGVTGILTGHGRQITPQDEKWYETTGASIGEVASDIPAMMAGGEVGAAGGAALGGFVGGAAAGPAGLAAGAGIGGVLGGGAGAFGAPQLIKSAYQEYLNYADNGNDLTFGEFLESAARITKETGKSAITGMAFSYAMKVLPIIKSMPGAEKILNTRAGKILEKPLTELTALTAATSVVEQEMPTAQSVIDNIAIIAGFKISQSLASKTIRKIKNPTLLKKLGEIGKKMSEEEFKEELAKDEPFKEIIIEQEASKEASESSKEPLEADSKQESIEKPEIKPSDIALKDGHATIPGEKGKRQEVKYTETEENLHAESEKLSKQGKHKEALKKFDELRDELHERLNQPENKLKGLNQEGVDFLLVDAEISRAKEAREKIEKEKASENIQTKGELEGKAEAPKTTRERSEPTKQEEQKQKPKFKKETETKDSKGILSGAREVVDKIKNFIPEKARRGIEKAVEAYDKFNREQKFFDILEEHIGNKRAGFIESTMKWRKIFEEPIKMEDGSERKLSKNELQDMLYYRQRTANPNKKGDTFSELSNRLPKEAKHLVDNTIDQHFKNWVKRWNENTATKIKINPREHIAEIYLPGLWKEKSRSYKQAEQYAADKMSKHPDKAIRQGFETEGPFVNKKVFETWRAAIEEGGLTPIYDNIFDLMKGYDEMMLRLEANNMFLEKLESFQSKGGEKLIQLSTDKEAYNQAKKDGWVPFDDNFLRRHQVGVGEDGKPIWNIASGPALVHPDAAPAFKGVFRKDAYKPEYAFWKGYDNLGNLAKVLRVSLSPFHFVALTESAFGAMGLKAVKGLPLLNRFFSENWYKDATLAMENSDGLQHRASKGLIFEMSDREAYKKAENSIERAIDWLPTKLESTKSGPILRKFSNAFMKYQKFLFNDYHPKLKIAAYDNYVEKAVKKYLKEGKELTDKALDRIERDVAESVNNQFGGQLWEMKRFFNDPKNMKLTRRVVGYPDWSVSAILQAVTAFSGGLKGEIARTYWIKYGAAWYISTSIGRFLLGGWYNDKDDGSIKWSPQRGMKALQEKDPQQQISFPLPDIDIKIGSVTINPGRDEKGKKLYSHFGKQALEIPRYGTDTFDSIFSKSNPIIQAMYKQITGGTPYKGESFPVRGKYSGGQFKPWDGARKGSVAEGISRGKELAGEFVPFFLKGLYDRGLATSIAAGAGGLPVRKGLSLHKAEPYIFDALRTKNIKKLNSLVKILKENNYNDSQIRMTITRVKKQWLPNSFLNRLAQENEDKNK